MVLNPVILKEAKWNDYSILEKVIIFFTFFPYIQIIPFPSDTQPYALLFSFFYLILYIHKIYFFKGMKLFLFAFIISLSILFLNFSLLGFRSIIGYISLFVIPITLSRIFRIKGIIPFNFIFICAFIWFFVAVLQYLTHPAILGFLMPRVSTSESRGMVSLAVEPSYYGLIMLFYLVIVLIFYKNKNKTLLQTLLVFQIVFLARSSFVVLLLIFLLGVYLLVKKPFWVICAGIVFFILMKFLIGLIPSIFPGRLGMVLVGILENPLELVLLDLSINDRVFHIVFTIKGFIDNHFLPRGFSAWTSYIHTQRVLTDYADYVTTGRILSAYGAALFELGFIGLFIITAINKILLLIRRESKGFFMFSIIFFNILLFMPIPFSLPITSLVLSYYMSINRN